MNRRVAWSSFVLALLLPLLAGCSYFQHSPAKAAPAPVRVIKLDSSVYNLADTDTNAYLRLGISIALASPVNKDDASDAKLKSIAHDTLVSLVTAETSAQLLSETGKAALKKAALAQMQKRLPDANIKTLYFDDFLVQH